MTTREAIAVCILIGCGMALIVMVVTRLAPSIENMKPAWRNAESFRAKLGSKKVDCYERLGEVVCVDLLEGRVITYHCGHYRSYCSLESACQ